VNKIFGPGNQYVTMAKQIVSRETVAIDMPAGPSELAVIADATSNPSFIASDLLSQAEHGPDSQVLLVTDSGNMIDRVKAELKIQLADLPRKDIAAEALNNSKMILLNNQEEVIEMVNMYAPEHLIIVTENYAELAEEVVNAGSVFLGDYTPESAGDYASGTNHTLPTNGWAHAYSGVNMDSFYKKITFQEISKYGLHNIGDAIMTMAEAEQLQAHSNAVSIRLRPNNNE
jgi:histidinol dehydrogenase